MLPPEGLCICCPSAYQVVPLDFPRAQSLSLSQSLPNCHLLREASLTALAKMALSVIPHSLYPCTVSLHSTFYHLICNFQNLGGDPELSI